MSVIHTATSWTRWSRMFVQLGGHVTEAEHLVYVHDTSNGSLLGLVNDVLRTSSRHEPWPDGAFSSVRVEVHR